MRSSYLRKSLAASAVLASSVAAVAGVTGSAQAAPSGPANSPLTVGDGAWSPDGSRYVYVDTNGAVITHNLPGGAAITVDPAKPGVVRTGPTFVDNGAGIVFSQTENGVSKLVSISAFTPAGDQVKETDPLSHLVSQMPEGTESAPDSNGKTLAFQHGVNGHQEIWVQDDFGRGSAGPIQATADGTSPTVSPDGKTIAFLRKDGNGDEQIWTVPWHGQSATPAAGTPVQLTNDAHDHLHPTFSADGTRIAFEQGPGNGAAATDVESIAATGGGQKQESAKPGVPYYQPLNKDSLSRMAGADRIGTAIAASQAQWPTAPYTGNDGRFAADSVVLSRSDQFADALGGSALATSAVGPLLLTPTDHLDSAVKAEIARTLGPASTHRTVYVLGGEQALSPAVFDAVKAMGYEVKRIAGPDRYATSVAIAEQVTSLISPSGWGQPDRVMVATGNLFPDALSAGAAAESGYFNGPAAGVVILTNDKQMPAVTAAYLAQVKAHDSAQNPTPVYGIGGQADAALTSAGVKHTGLVGIDRYQTSYLVAKTFFGDWEAHTAPASMGFATGLTWPDALSGGAFMGEKHGPLLLVNPENWLSSEAQNYLYGWAPATDNAYVFGGTAAVGDLAQNNIGGGISGPAGYNLQNNPKA
jgi:putative cell wall-binding protein